ncbi:hypothetical protein CCM_04078 [Cordyceps militaris CM01]|uniref:Uncharacterized protein n=1 Tax=Cordyceps militaris (strain CM01) TaxID=983644 RepID=G3JDN0_CORMM|nr:uncharacterized protein CCM_04078 [Cordyceps militaris CM01]EGX92705.1 hypothetical protein CCM_04078 [Cordyceps militaris CM01]
MYWHWQYHPSARMQKLPANWYSAERNAKLGTRQYHGAPILDNGKRKTAPGLGSRRIMQLFNGRRVLGS